MGIQGGLPGRVTQCHNQNLLKTSSQIKNLSSTYITVIEMFAQGTDLTRCSDSYSMAVTSYLFQFSIEQITLKKNN